MSISGAKAWAGVIDNRVPDILKLVVAVWKRVAPGTPDEREDDITTRLCVAIQRSRTARRMMFYVHYQTVELDPGTGDEFGRMDIAFYPSGESLVPREDIYFCLECKRLNVIKGGVPRAYSTEYVTQGMQRFVSGQYSRAVRHGGMIGYVRDGDVARAMGNVETAISSRYATLAMKPPGRFVASVILPRVAHARETHHQRRHGGPVFRIHHLFMAGDPKVAAAMTVGKPSGKTKGRRGKAKK